MRQELIGKYEEMRATALSSKRKSLNVLEGSVFFYQKGMAKWMEILYSYITPSSKTNDAQGEEKIEEFKDSFKSALLSLLTEMTLTTIQKG